MQPTHKIIKLCNYTIYINNTNSNDSHKEINQPIQAYNKPKQGSGLSI